MVSFVIQQNYTSVLGLSLFWTNCLRHDMTLADLVQLLCRKTAEMANLGHRKGAIKEGYDADFVVWDPDSTFKVILMLLAK